MNDTFPLSAVFNHEIPLGAVALTMESVTNFARWGPDVGNSITVLKLLLEN